MAVIPETASYPDRKDRYVETCAHKSFVKDCHFCDAHRAILERAQEKLLANRGLPTLTDLFARYISVHRMAEAYWAGKLTPIEEKLLEDRYRPEELLTHKPEPVPAMAGKCSDPGCSCHSERRAAGLPITNGTIFIPSYADKDRVSHGLITIPKCKDPECFCHRIIEPPEGSYNPNQEMRDEAYRRINAQARIAILAQMAQQEAGKDAAKMQAEHDPGCADAKCWCRA